MNKQLNTRRRPKIKAIASILYILYILLLIIIPINKVFSEQTALCLEEALNIALSNSRRIKQKTVSLRKSEHALAQANTEAFPIITLEASTSYMLNPLEGVTVGQGELGEIEIAPGVFVPLPDRDIVMIPDVEPTYFKIGATLTQPIFTWGKITNAIDIAALGVDISFIELEQAKQELKRNVKIAYFGAVFSKRSYQILADLVVITEEILKDRELAYGEGLITFQAVLEARSQLAQLKKMFIQAEEGYYSALATLCFLLDLEEVDILLTSTYRTELPPLDEEALKQEVYTNSFALKILRKQLGQAQKNVAIKQGDSLFLPDIVFKITFDVAGQHVPFITENWTDTWNINLTFSLGTSLDLFDSTRSYWKIKQAEDDVELAMLCLTQLASSLDLKTRQAFEKVRITYYTILEEQAKLEQAKESYKNAQFSYENQVITREKEHMAKLFLHTTEIEYERALFEFEMALTNLEFLAGRDF